MGTTVFDLGFEKSGKFYVQRRLLNFLIFSKRGEIKSMKRTVQTFGFEQGT